MRHILTLKKSVKFTTAKEWIEDCEKITQKVKKLAIEIRKSKHPIIFTGAGISTSVGIPDYRSGQQTVVPTGPGIWNRVPQTTPPKLRIDQIVDQAIPSKTHMAIKTLIKKRVFKFLISQNTDGLHLKSGIHFSEIAQLHGNRNLQKCIKCERKYFRDFRTIKRGLKMEGKRSHQTGRQCENCGGDLIDSIVYFGEKLPIADLGMALQQASLCDFLLCIGSSLTVKPSANVPIIALKKNATVCIVNIQQTPFDEAASLKINGFCDPVIDQLMQELGIPIDPFVIYHYLQMRLTQGLLRIEGKDEKGSNFTFIRNVKYNGKQYLPKGHLVDMEISDNQYEVELNFYGTKAPLLIYLPAYYKLHHGEDIRLKIEKKSMEQGWSIQQLF